MARPPAVAWYPALLAATLALSAWCAAQDRLPGELSLARRVQDLPGWFEPLAEAIRAVTTTQTAVGLGLAGLLLYLALAREWRSWLVLSAAMLAVPPVQAAIKNIVDRPRPTPDELERRATFTSESFPSGHVMSGTALLLLAAWLLASFLPAGPPRIAVWATAVALCLLNGLANVYEGVHWPTDVLGGYLWALVIAAAAWLALRRLKSEPRTK